MPSLPRSEDNKIYCPHCEAELETNAAIIRQGRTQTPRILRNHVAIVHGRHIPDQTGVEANTPETYYDRKQARLATYAYRTGYSERADTVMAEAGPTYGTRMLY